MKKHLLMLLSWTMIMLGAISFASCSDDDDKDDNKTSEPTTASGVFSKYGNTKGARIDGDNVIWVTNDEESNSSAIMIIHYNGDNIDGGTSYTKLENEAAAKAYYEEAKADGENVSIDGNYVIVKMNDEGINYYQGLDKNSLVTFLNQMEAFGL